MAEPEAIVEALGAALGAGRGAGTSGGVSASEGARVGARAGLGVQDLVGVKILVTAGPTMEDLDPVRFVGNRSSGKMGFAVAERAVARGARVALITGPVSLATPRGASRIDVRSAAEMEKALAFILGNDLTGVDAVVMSAAVADYRPRVTSPTKLKRSSEPLQIELVPNPDLLAGIGARRVGPRPVLVGFALETEKDEALALLARAKLKKKKVDLVVANEAGEALSRDDNRATLVTESDAEALGVLPKANLADRILDRVKELLDKSAR
jgi:phosphopantothenoylcysteine decarboxylase/phosphopantothenate--cysteine ligase